MISAKFRYGGKTIHLVEPNNKTEHICENCKKQMVGKTGPVFTVEGKCDYISKSSTTSPTTHIFPIPNSGFKFAIIDPPGNCDTNGIDQDSENFNNTLAYLANIPELHAIAIVVKANQQKLTSRFEYCLAQLLMRLHISAVKNLVFVFTNAGVLGNAGKIEN